MLVESSTKGLVQAVHSESEGPVHLEHDPSQAPQVVVEVIWYSPSGHVDWHLPEVVSRSPELHSVQSSSFGPVHSLHEL